MSNRADIAAALGEFADTLRRLEAFARQSLGVHPDDRPDLEAASIGHTSKLWLSVPRLLKYIEAAKGLGAVGPDTLETIQRAAPIVHHWDRLEERNATDTEVRALADLRKALNIIARNLTA